MSFQREQGKMLQTALACQRYYRKGKKTW